MTILTEPFDSEVLERMPKWFKRLREAYQKRELRVSPSSDIPQPRVSIDEDEFIRIVKVLIKHLR